MGPEHIHLVTGRLAEAALRRVVGPLAERQGFAWSIDVLPITVAALMTPAWVARHIRVPSSATRVLLPGYCEGDLAPLREQLTIPVERGPRDLRQLPEYFGRGGADSDYGSWDIEILAEINHAPRWPLPELLREAQRLAESGADLIDLGCDPGGVWDGVGVAVRAVRELGLRVSIDSLAPEEIAPAVRAGAELVLSVNSTNRHAAADWGCEVVAIPDDPRTLAGLDDTLEFLDRANVRFRVDPIVEPIGCGFAASLGRYLDMRRRLPNVEMLMGVGNLTELTDVDSAGVNALLLGFCQELGIRSVLTTQVINWARSSVRECDVARRLARYAIEHGVPPKNVDARLVALRDPRLLELGDDELAELASQIKDHNYRLFAERGRLHLLGAGNWFQDTDPFDLFAQLLATHPKNVDPSHAFYLGFELAKASIALTLGKNYRQDEALDWGHLTVAETKHRRRGSERDESRRRPAREGSESADAGASEQE